MAITNALGNLRALLVDCLPDFNPVGHELTLKLLDDPSDRSLTYVEDIRPHIKRDDDRSPVNVFAHVQRFTQAVFGTPLLITSGRRGPPQPRIRLTGAVKTETGHR